MFLLELHHGLFSDSFDLEAPRHDGWRLITPCDRNLPRYDPRGKELVYQLEDVAAICPFFQEAGNLDQAQFGEFVRLVKTMFNTAQSGHDWPDVMHQQVHEAGQVTVRRGSGKIEKHVIIQFGKKKTLIRIFAFISAHGRKCALVSHMFEKPANSRKTPAKEQARSQKILQLYFDAIDTENIQFIDAQGGKHGFLKFV